MLIWRHRIRKSHAEIWDVCPENRITSLSRLLHVYVEECDLLVS
jgi:hypothetical protein